MLSYASAISDVTALRVPLLLLIAIHIADSLTLLLLPLLLLS
jgi:hypothetical protein